MKDLREEIDRICVEAYQNEKCNKFRGALTVELIRNSLHDMHMPVSARDVFIRAIPLEIDLLILKRGAVPDFNLLYRPGDVAAALEVKYRGPFGERAFSGTKANFERIGRIGSHIECIYVTVRENRGYKWAINSQNLGFPAFTLFLDQASDCTPTGEWQKLIAHITRVVA